MKKIHVLMTILALLPWAARPLFAQAGEAGRILEEGADARGLALGRAYTAVVNDNTSLYWNPAGLGGVLQTQVSALQASLYMDSAYGYLGFASPFRKKQGSWGAHLLRMGTGTAEKRSALNDPTGSFSYQEIGLGLGAGVRGLISPRLSAGTGIKVLQRSLDTSVDSQLALDVGTQYRLSPKARLGMNLQNVVSMRSGDTDDRLPFKTRVGASYQLFGGLLTALEMEDLRELSLGTEYNLGLVSLRAGLRERGVSLGGGIVFRGFQLDYATQSHAELGALQRFSLAYSFGNPQKADHTAEARKLLEEATVLWREGKFAAAHEKLSKAESLSEWVPEVVRQRNRLEEMRRRLPGDFKREDLAPLYRRGLIGYMEGDYVRAVFLLNAALGGGEKKNQALEEFVRRLSQEKGVPFNLEDRKPLGELISLKLIRAEEALIDEDYKKALQYCEEAVLLDEENATSHTRLGTVYYIMGLRDKALAAWKQALSINPSDETLKSYIKKIESK
ncbi:MAG: tetratricopeptide repeat protein [Elusimicrobia bacterium]|nr:tetratricopeptide repeat protein [Elusimicrobiota bacterium]